MRAGVAALGKHAGGLLSAGMHLVFGSRAGDRFAILMYHRVAQARAGAPAPTWNVTPSRFRAQMTGLAARGFRFSSLRSVVADAVAGRKIPAGTVVVTFDDGYANNYVHAWPVLRELGIPATIFVASAYVGSGAPFPFDRWSTDNAATLPAEDWLPLTWEQCREMEAWGLVEIGSHSHRHLDFRGDAAAFRRDLDESRAELAAGLGAARRDLLFAFPYGGRAEGHASEALMAVVREAGLACALTTETELVSASSSPFGWGRLEAVGSDSPATLAAKAAGWYEWMGVAREAFRMLAPPDGGHRARGTA